MSKRLLGFLCVALLPLLVGTAHADLIGDAKSLLSNLQGMGDYGLATATTAIDNARGACQSSLTSATVSMNRLTAIRAENQSLAGSLPAGATPLNMPDANSLDAARLALESASSAWRTAVQTTSIAATTANALSRSGGDAIGVLRSLFPKPLGTRPAIYRGKCRVPGTNLETDCDLPNGPPSDSEIRSAITQGNNVASGVASIGATSLNAYYQLVMNAQKDWTTRYTAYSDLLAKQRMSIEQARLTKLNAAPVVAPATPYREAIRVRK